MDYSATTSKRLFLGNNTSRPPSYTEQQATLSDSIRCDTEALQQLATLTCGRECVMAQTVIDRLLGRLVSLETERTELLAANRTWATHYQLVQEKHKKEIKQMEEKLRRRNEQVIATEGKLPSSIQEALEQINLLKHQAQVYKEDFKEERKSRVRAHAQMDVLRSELKRERKSRAKSNRTSENHSS